jgi:autotransporter-associated beta strand protein
LTLDGDGSGLLVLSGTNNTYGGGTLVAAGTLVVTNSGALPYESSLTVGNAAAFAGGPTVVAAPAAAASTGGLAPVPEPGTIALLVAGLGSAGLYCRLRRRSEKTATSEMG